MTALLVVLVVLWVSTCGWFWMRERAWAGDRQRTESVRHEVEARLSRAEHELQEVRATRGAVLADVSHELRTPLTSICGSVELLQRRATDAATLDVLDRIHRNAQTLVILVNKILDISKLNAGRMELTMGPVPLGECLEGAWLAVAPQAEAKGLRIELDMPDSPVLVVGSFERLQQVFCNLLGNAVKFTRQGRIGIGVTAEARTARIRVSDTGVGIPPDKLEHVFDEFTQADASVRKVYGGTGLGLAISRKLVSLHGGRLEVESEVGRGSTFTVTLPLYRA